MRQPASEPAARASAALLALRVAMGAAFVVHGYPKMQHATSWSARVLPGTPPWLQALAAFAEFGGGLALIAGFATPLFAFLIACNMVVAIFFVLLPHGATFVSAHGGPSLELEVIYLAVAFTLVALGPGAYALDRLLGNRRGRRTQR